MHAIAEKSNTPNTTHKHFTHEIQFYNYIHTQPPTWKKKNLSKACKHATTHFMHPFKFSIAVVQNKIITTIWQLITAGNQQEGRLSNHAHPKLLL
jgi:hypothetical protein